MISSRLLQNNYINLYTVLRNYIWPFYVVELIAGLEVEVFKAIPKLSEVKRMLDRLESSVNSIIDDPEIRKEFVAFDRAIATNNSSFLRVIQIQEVIQQ